MGVYTFIPVRLNSKRFPRKPLYRIFGKPLIQHVYNNFYNSIFNVNYILTPDFEIYKYCKFNNMPVILNSNKNIKCGTDRVAEAAKILNLSNDDIIINIQGDLPFVNTVDLTTITHMFSQDNNLYWLTILKKLKKNNINNRNVVKAICKKKNQNEYIKIINFKRLLDNSDFNYDIFHHVGIYAFRNNFLQIFYNLNQTINEKKYSLEQLRGIDNNYNIYGIFSDFNYKSIDTPEDINLIKNINKEE
jgi:3-deoxy-manno-octulosonate cytidylyltransferase (CMP-KDO synthetase)